MRVGLLSFEYPPDTGFGGIGTHTWYQARALAQLGHEVHVIAGSLEPGTFRYERDGVRIVRVLDSGPYGPAVTGLREAGQGWASNRLQTAFGAYQALRDTLRRVDLDIVEYPDCGGDGILVSTLLPVRTAVRFHSPAQMIMANYGADEDDIEVTAFLEQVAINQADVRIAPSAFLASEVINQMAVPAPVHVVRNGIDLDLFDRDEGVDVVERFGLPTSGAVTILFSSRLERRKGGHLLPEICASTLGSYRHVHIVIAGEDTSGTFADAVRSAVDSLGAGDRLHQLGRQPQPEVRALLKHVDIHLLPTLWENAPYACIEAMAAGCAVIASDSSGVPELIRDGVNGILARTGDAPSFVEGLSRLIEDRALRERLGESARRTIEANHDARATALQTIEVWRGPIPAGPT